MTICKLNEHIKTLTSYNILKTNMFGEEMYEAKYAGSKGCFMDNDFIEIWDVVLENEQEIEVEIFEDKIKMC